MKNKKDVILRSSSKPEPLHNDFWTPFVYLLITQQAFPTHDFISRSTKIWNNIAPKLKLMDYSHKISAAKSSLKRMLLKTQCSGDIMNWNENNFDLNNLHSCDTTYPIN